MMAHQHIDNDVGALAAVEYIAYNVQPVDREPLDYVGHCDDEAVRPVEGEDRIDDLAVVFFLVMLAVIGINQLIDDIGIVGGKRFPDLGTGVFAGDEAADVN